MRLSQVGQSVNPVVQVAMTSSRAGHALTFLVGLIIVDQCFQNTVHDRLPANKSNGSEFFLFNGVIGLCRLFGGRSVMHLGVFVTENFVLHEPVVSTIVGVNDAGYIAGAVGAK